LRERVFADIKNDNLRTRCLDVIRELHLEADTLIEKNRGAIEETQARWSNEEGEEKKSIGTLVHIDDNVGGFDPDDEAIAKLREDIFRNVDEKNFQMEQKLS